MAKDYKYDPVIYWNARSKAYNIPKDRRQQTAIETGFFIDLYKSVSKGLPLSVLDIGSGYGRLSTSFRKARVPVKMFMCDIVEGFIKPATNKTGITTILWDGDTLPYKDRVFDVVVSFDVLLHVPEKSINKLWTEHTRVCNSFLFIATVDYSQDSYTSLHCFDHDYSKLIKGTEDFDMLVWKRWKNKPKRLNVWLRRIHACYS